MAETCFYIPTVDPINPRCWIFLMPAHPLYGFLRRVTHIGQKIKGKKSLSKFEQAIRFIWSQVAHFITSKPVISDFAGNDCVSFKLHRPYRRFERSLFELCSFFRPSCPNPATMLLYNPDVLERPHIYRSLKHLYSDQALLAQRAYKISSITTYTSIPLVVNQDEQELKQACDQYYRDRANYIKLINLMTPVDTSDCENDDDEMEEDDPMEHKTLEQLRELFEAALDKKENRKRKRSDDLSPPPHSKRMYIVID
jgi:hypothetical protein